MTAPARVARPASRTKTQQPPAAQPDRTGARRSAAADRAYARRAQRSDRAAAPAPGPKVERKPGSASRVTFVVLVMVLLVGGVVATLWFSTQATADAYRLEKATQTTNQLSVRVGQLQQQVAQQDSPPSLALRAQQLGMVPAGDPAHLVVGSDGKVTVIGTPSAAEPPPPLTTAPPTSTSVPPAGAAKAGTPASGTPASGTASTPATTGTTPTPPAGG
jgi:hypothetical protein